MDRIVPIYRSAEILRSLRLRRKRAGIRQRDLADRLGWPQSVLSERENGRRRTSLEEVDQWRDAIDGMVS